MSIRTVFLIILFLVYHVSLADEVHTAIPPVVLTAKKQDSHSPSGAEKNIITREEIAGTGATSLSQVLQQLGGVQLQDTTGNGSQVMLSMRGFGINASSNALLLVNGIPITNPDMAPPDLNAIPLQEIESVEIVSGSESVLYGDQAVGGIVNIVTRQQTISEVELSCSAGSYNQHLCYAAMNHHYKQLKFGLGILNNHTDNYRDHNDYDQNLLSGNLNYLYQTGNLGFNFQLANERMQYPGALSASQVRQNRRQVNNDTNFFADRNGLVQLQQKQILSENWHMETALARREMHGNGVLTSPFDQSRITNFIKPQLKGKVGCAQLMTGVDFEDDQYQLNSLFGLTKDSLKKYGAFALVNIPVATRLSVAAGVRAAKQKSVLESTTFSDNINGAIATTLGVTFQFKPDANIYLRRAESFRFPKADENASVSPGISGLKTQKGVSYETGIKWDWKKFKTKFSLFQLNLVNEITFDPNQTPQDPFGTNTNLDPTVRRGFSLSENYQATKKITLSGQYNYINARFQNGPDSGNRIPLVSENVFHAGANFKITDNWNFFTEANYLGNQYAANDNANIGGKIGGYTVYNFNLRFQKGHFVASFRVNNLFNKYYYYYSVFQPSAPFVSFYPAPGRNVLLTLKYVFS